MQHRNLLFISFVGYVITHLNFIVATPSEIKNLNNTVQNGSVNATASDESMDITTILTNIMDMLDYLPNLDWDLETDADNETVLNFKLEFENEENSTRLARHYGMDESRKRKNKKGMMKFLPMFMLPMLFQSAMIPMMLSSLKMMLVKSLIIGKVALLLIGLNALRRSTESTQQRLTVEHYGYTQGNNEEIGAWFNS